MPNGLKNLPTSRFCYEWPWKAQSRMLVHGVPPHDVTFIGLLSACSHSGLVNEGSMFFKAMRDYYGIIPQMQHFCCMLAMYGRAKSPVWVALLHGNEKMLDWIRRNLLSDENVGVGTLALLSNHYASFVVGEKHWIELDARNHM